MENGFNGSMVLLFVLRVICQSIFSRFLNRVCYSIHNIIKDGFVLNGSVLGKMMARSDSPPGNDTTRAYVLFGIFDVF